MAARVQDRSAELERAVREKTRLLRELHHRVKNNFQVIASLLALQKRSLGREQKALLRYPEDRVQALATAYRLSYASGEIGRVDLGELIEQNVTYMRQSVDLSPTLLLLDKDVGQVDVDLDTAIPLSLLMAELLAGFTDAAKLSGRPVRLVIRRDEERNLLLVLTGPPPDGVPEAAALSSRLANAFVQQLGGKLEIEAGDPMTARVMLPPVGGDEAAAPAEAAEFGPLTARAS